MDIIKTGHPPFSHLDTLIGRLTHVSVVLPHMLHFLGRIQRLCHSAAKRRKVGLHMIHKKDLRLLLFLDTAHKGIDINLYHILYTNSRVLLRSLPSWPRRIQPHGFCLEVSNTNPATMSRKHKYAGTCSYSHRAFGRSHQRPNTALIMLFVINQQFHCSRLAKKVKLYR